MVVIVYAIEKLWHLVASLGSLHWSNEMSQRQAPWAWHSPSLLSFDLETKEELAEHLGVVEHLTINQVAAEQARGRFLVVAAVVATTNTTTIAIIVVELQSADIPSIVEVVVEEKKGLAENPTSRSWDGGIVRS